MELTTAYIILFVMILALIGVQFFHHLAKLALILQATSSWLCDLPGLLWTSRHRWHQHYAQAQQALLPPAPATGIEKHWQQQQDQVAKADYATA